MFAVAFVAGGFILCQEAVRFDKDLQPRFSAHQIERCSAATRDGLARWTATPHGRALVKRFNSVDYRIMIVEDTSEEAAGKAPEPGIATMASVGESSPVKTYLLILNPSFVQPNPIIAVPVGDNWYELRFDIVMRETGGVDVRIENFTVEALALRGVPVHSQTYPATFITDRGYPASIQAGKYLRFNFTKRWP